MGATSRNLIEHTPCSVMVVPRPRRGLMSCRDADRSGVTGSPLHGHGVTGCCRDSARSDFLNLLLSALSTDQVKPDAAVDKRRTDSCAGHINENAKRPAPQVGRRTVASREGTGMLSDAEQRRLTEIERRLRSEDPEFVERFGHGMQGTPQKWRSMTARGWLIAAALTMGLAVLMASAAMALIALSMAGVSAGLWLTGDSHSTDGRPPPRR
jgi:hypothetical protein